MVLQPQSAVSEQGYIIVRQKSDARMHGCIIVRPQRAAGKQDYMILRPHNWILRSVTLLCSFFWKKGPEQTGLQEDIFGIFVNWYLLLGVSGFLCIWVYGNVFKY
jgi:hypothetical protein